MSPGDVPLVLLCSEEDDLDLIDVVHRARQHGMIPQVVAGIEHDDSPLLQAIADPDNARALFVVLRSDFLSVERMREIKATFGRARQRKQELLAVRLDPGRTDAVLATLVARAESTRAVPRAARKPRAELSAVTPLVERSGVLRLFTSPEGTSARAPADPASALPLDPASFMPDEESDLELGIEVDDGPSDVRREPEHAGELDRTWMDAQVDAAERDAIARDANRTVARRRSGAGLAVGSVALAAVLGGGAWMFMHPGDTGAPAPATESSSESEAPARSRVTVPEPASRSTRTDPPAAAVPAEPVVEPTADEGAAVVDESEPRARTRKRSQKSEKADAVDADATPPPSEPAQPDAAQPQPAKPQPGQPEPSAPAQPAAPKPASDPAKPDAAKPEPTKIDPIPGENEAQP